VTALRHVLVTFLKSLFQININQKPITNYINDCILVPVADIIDITFY